MHRRPRLRSAALPASFDGTDWSVEDHVGAQTRVILGSGEQRGRLGCGHRTGWPPGLALRRLDEARPDPGTVRRIAVDRAFAVPTARSSRHMPDSTPTLALGLALLRGLQDRKWPLTCGAKGTRTPGLLDANQTLFQLSYSPECLPTRVPGAHWLESNPGKDEL
jgi:hypothetical protein